MKPKIEINHHYRNRHRSVYKIGDTEYINWKIVPRMKHLDVESIESAKITSRNDVEFLSRRSGDIPVDILEKLDVELYPGEVAIFFNYLKDKS
jgi:hypothetical protein